MGYYLDGAEALKAAKAAKQRQKKAEAAAQRQQRQAEAAPAAGEDGEDEGNMRPAPAGLSQEELIRRAFAGDDVQAEFAAAKAAEVEGELPQVRGPSLPPARGPPALQRRSAAAALTLGHRPSQCQCAACRMTAQGLLPPARQPQRPFLRVLHS